jgi:hypothetical protein
MDSGYAIMRATEIYKILGFINCLCRRPLCFVLEILLVVPNKLHTLTCSIVTGKELRNEVQLPFSFFVTIKAIP